MPDGKFCNKKPVETEEELKALLGDTGGKQYYEEMKSLEVDSELLWKTIQNTLKSRMKTWLEICAHCGMCADSCFLYLINDCDPEQIHDAHDEQERHQRPTAADAESPITEALTQRDSCARRI